MAERLEDRLKTVQTNAPTELQGVAQELFDTSNTNQKTNLKDAERSLLLVNQKIFCNILDMPELDPSQDFKELSASVDGWKVGQFVAASQSTRTSRGGGGFIDKVKGLFNRKGGGVEDG